MSIFALSLRFCRSFFNFFFSFDFFFALFRQNFVSSSFFFFFLLSHAAFTFLEFIKLVCDSLFTHFYPHDLNNFDQMIYVFHCSFFIDFCSVQFLIDVFFSCQDKFNVVLGDESQTLTAPTRSGGAANPMHVIFRTFGHIKVQDKLNHWNIETPRGNVCSH